MIVGGSGHVGEAIIRGLPQNEFVVISRNPKAQVRWDGLTLGPWANELEGIDAVINLAGRTVNCRYNETNLREMMDSRVISARLVGEAIAQAKKPPKLWLQASTATLYAHRFDAPNDEFTGIIGGGEAGSDPKWDASIEVVKAWEKTLAEAKTPYTRKVALRSSVTLSIDKGSIFDVLCTLTRRGFGGTLGTGKQFVSWIHEEDFCRALEFLIQHEELDGPVNVCSPHPLPQKEFAAEIRKDLGVSFGLPATEWMVKIGAWAMQTESELVLKSRRVVPTRLLQAGFEFKYPSWPEACQELVSRI